MDIVNEVNQIIRQTKSSMITEWNQFFIFVRRAFVFEFLTKKLIDKSNRNSRAAQSVKVQQSPYIVWSPKN